MKRILIAAIFLIYLTLPGSVIADDGEFPILKQASIFKFNIALYQNVEISLKEINLYSNNNFLSEGPIPLSDKELESISAGGLQFRGKNYPYPSSALIILWDEANNADPKGDAKINATVNW